MFKVLMGELLGGVMAEARRAAGICRARRVHIVAKRDLGMVHRVGVVRLQHRLSQGGDALISAAGCMFMEKRREQSRDIVVAAMGMRAATIRMTDPCFSRRRASGPGSTVPTSRCSTTARAGRGAAAAGGLFMRERGEQSRDVVVAAIGMRAVLDSCFSRRDAFSAGPTCSTPALGRRSTAAAGRVLMRQ